MTVDRAIEVLMSISKQGFGKKEIIVYSPNPKKPEEEFKRINNILYPFYYEEPFYYNEEVVIELEEEKK